MKRTAVINIVGLCAAALGPGTPRLNAFIQKGSLRRIDPAFPAVTCTAQSDYLTGAPPSVHGIVGNGWHNSVYGAYLLTRYASEYEFPEIPRFVRKAVIPAIYYTGLVLGKYKNFKNAPAPIKSN